MVYVSGIYLHETDLVIAVRPTVRLKTSALLIDQRKGRQNLQKYISGSFPDKTKMTNGNRDNLLLCPTYFMLLFLMENCECLQNFVLNTIKSLSQNKRSKHLARTRLIVCTYFLWAKKIVHFYRVTSKVDVMAVNQKVDGHGRKGLILGSSLTLTVKIHE